MTSPDEFDRALNLLRLRYSELDIRAVRQHGTGLAERDLTWREWTDSLARRLSVLQTYSHDGDRPSFTSTSALAVDVLSLLVALERAETLDVSSGDAA